MNTANNLLKEEIQDLDRSFSSDFIPIRNGCRIGQPFLINQLP